MTSFIEKLSALFEETELSIFTPETVFRELPEWSSLLALSVIAMVDEEYEVRLKGEDVRKAQTIEDLFKVIQSKS